MDKNMTFGEALISLKSGGKVWAQGMLAELNKGLQRKFTMDGVEA